jgi:polysaccharide biosynthesis protein PslG
VIGREHAALVAGLAALAIGGLGCGSSKPPVTACVPKGTDACGARTDCEALGNSGQLRSGHPTSLRDPAAGQGVAIGFNDSAYLAGEATASEDAELERRAGSTLWRVPLDWGAVEPKPGELHFQVPDAIYCAARAAGVRPIFHITGIPAWAGPPGLVCPVPCLQPPAPGHDRDLSDFARAVARRYPEAAAIEAWNEPNMHQFWPHPDPARYTAVLRAIYAGAKSGDPRIPVLGGAVSNAQTDDPRTGDLSLSHFLEAMFATGAGAYMDGLSIHAYPIHPLSDPRELFRPSLDEARRAAAGAGLGASRIWITETGVATPPTDGGSVPFTPEGQADTLLEMFRTAEGAPDVDAIIFQTLVAPNDLVPSPAGYGWVSQPDPSGAFHPKPVYCRFAALEAMPINCDRPVPLDPAG